MRTAICISGLARTFRQTHASFVANVLEPLRERGPVDVFVSVWDSGDLFSDKGEPPDLNAIRELYRPVVLDVESFATVRGGLLLSNYIRENRTVLNPLIRDGVLVAMPAQYKVMRCNMLKRNVEGANGFRYDLVLRTRFDMDISRLDVNAFDLTRINCLYDHDGLMGDYFYAGPSDQMDKLCELFNHYADLLAIEGTDLGPERTLKSHADRCGLKTNTLTGYTYALVRDTHRQEFRWREDHNRYRPVDRLLICSALYYPGSLARGDLIVRDNRFYPGKYSETFLPWYQYVRRHYPHQHLVLFADVNSPIPIQPLLDSLPEPYAVFTDTEEIAMDSGGPRVHVKWLSEYAGQYFRPMQRNLVEGIATAYTLAHGLFWLDSDAFINSSIVPLILSSDVAAPNIAHHQMTMDSVCTFISAGRLHALDRLDIHLPTYLYDMLANGPTETRMHSLQEGGLYKTFCYGRITSLAGEINLTHLSCYDRFMAFLRANPLDTPEYRDLLARLEGFDMARLPGVELSFGDMWEEIKP